MECGVVSAGRAGGENPKPESASSASLLQSVLHPGKISPAAQGHGNSQNLGDFVGVQSVNPGRQPLEMARKRFHDQKAFRTRLYFPLPPISRMDIGDQS